MSTTPRLRFAPSPTGTLHLGNARTALFNWLEARRRGGTLVLRIEDTDRERSTPAHEAGILDDLMWLGLGWDEGIDAGGAHGPYRQSERLDLYRARAAALVAGTFAYPCFCDLATLEAERSAQRDAGRVSIYGGRCRGIDPEASAARRAAGEPHAIRFDVTRAAAGAPSVDFADLVHGEVRFPMAQIGDFVLLRQDGSPAYNFAVVVDDVAMAITLVIRGDDHLSNTPRQVLLYRALHETPPAFAHLPLIVAPGGAPLSKREGAVSVGAFRDAGYLPEALLNHLALLGWSPADGREEMTVEEIVARFDLARVSRSPAVFDRQKLDALAAKHVARLPPERLADHATEHFVKAGLLPEAPDGALRAWAGRVAGLYADRLPRFGDLPREAALLFDFDAPHALHEEEVRTTLADPKARAVIEAILEGLDAEPLTAQRFQALAVEARRRTGAKGRDLYHPIRIGLTGYPSGPELVRLLPILDEGSRLPLPRPVASCGARARALLDVTSRAAR